ncbi:MAG: hypothetical protein ACO3E1_10070 [Flavobacteriales bacterium]
MKIFRGVSILVLILFLSYFNLSAQDNLYKNQIKFTPGKIFHVYYSGLEFSYQRNYYKYATEISFTRIMNTQYPAVAISIPSNKGYKLQLEQKFFGTPSYFKSIEIKPYYAINTSYSQLLGREGISVFTPYEGHSIADVRKDFFCLNGILGWDMQYKHLIVNAYLGLGIKHEIITYDNLPKNSSPYNTEWLFLNINPGHYWCPNILGNIKIGYAF